MKLTKFFPVAVAALALASCTSDELFVEKGVEQQKVKGGLTVTLDEMTFDGQAVTRQGNKAGTGKIVWQNGDQINVYDQDVTRYDEYKFLDSKFVGANNPNVTVIGNPAYALFPGDRVDYTSNKKAVMRIPGLIIYDEESEVGQGDDLFYVSNLPLWGTATGTYPEATVSMKYLTGAMRINLKNAFADNVTFLKIEAQDGVSITGAFEADMTDAANAVLKQGTSSLAADNVMYVDLREVPSYLTYLYLPIIARHYDYLKVMTTTQGAGTIVENNGENADQILSELKASSLLWTTIRNWDAGVDFVKGQGLSLFKETQYDLKNVNTTEELSEALAMYANGISKDDNNPCINGNLVLNIGTTGTPLQVTRTSDNYKDDYTIYVPAIDPSITTITINCLGGIKPTTGANDLRIVDLTTKAGYEGKIILNANKITTSDLANITVNLSKTSLTLVGDFEAGKKVSNFNIKSVRDLTFGDGTNATKVASASNVTVDKAESVTIADNATVKANMNLVETIGLKTVTIEENGSFVDNPSSPANMLKVLNADVYVYGAAADIYQFASAHTVYVGSDGTASGDGKSNGQVNQIYSIGKIYIANRTESEAIKTAIHALGNNTITLKQGYVKKIDYATYEEFAASASDYYVKPLANLTESDCDSKVVTINLDEICGHGLTAIAEIDGSLLDYSAYGTKYHFVNMTTSKWGGKVITNSDYVGSALAKIYTASELASIDNSAPKYKLYNNLDLDNKAWSNPDLKKSFTGLDPRFTDKDAEDFDHLNCNANGLHTISNLYISGSTADSYGLFGEVTPAAALTIEKFILNGVKCDITHKGALGIGTVVGIANALTQSFTLQDVTVTGTTGIIGSTACAGANTDYPSGVQYVGGLIGQVKGIKAITVKNNSVSVPTIEGQAYLGGIIGGAASGTKAVAIDGNTVDLTNGFVTSVKPRTYDVINANYGTVGMVIGQAVGTVTIGTTTANTVNDQISNKRKNLGFAYNFMTAKTTDSYTTDTTPADVKYGFFGGNILVGYSPKSALTSLKTGVSPSTITHDLDKWCCYDAGKEIEKRNAAHTINDFVRWSNWPEGKPE